MEKMNITIIGAGAVGLAVAYQLSKKYNNVILLEQHDSFGQETSSRNSEVIHAGIYYPKDSLKAKLCVKGKQLLYDFLNKNNIPFNCCGKYITAVEKEEEEGLETLRKQAQENGVELEYISQNQIKEKLPCVKAHNALFSATTGIFDTHQYMQSLEQLCISQDVIISYQSRVINIEKSNNLYQITIKEADENQFQFLSEIVINSTGLNCQKTAQLIGIDNPDYKIYYAKGEYFHLPGKYKDTFSSLIYPVVPTHAKSLGIHTVIDLQGMLKCGPNIHYIDDIDYDVDETHRDEFLSAVSRYLPFINKDDLVPDMSGIRAKRQGPEDGFKDFIIQEETDQTYPGFINLIGIESPGLTSSLAIAETIENLIII